MVAAKILILFAYINTVLQQSVRNVPGKHTVSARTWLGAENVRNTILKQTYLMPHACIRGLRTLTRHRGVCTTRQDMPLKQKAGSKRKGNPSDTAEPRDARKHDSHLYTDDNPESTLHGTGFADAAAADRTIHLIRKRSLTYQFQVVNTMFYRAKHHPHPNAQMQSAMDIFQTWLHEYQTRKEQLVKYKTAKRSLVEQCLKCDEAGQLAPADDSLTSSDTFQAALGWARRYVSMPTGKRLANTLTTSNPEEPDMDSLRTTYLQSLVPADKAAAKKQCWRLDKDGHRQLSDLHLQWILFGYSPAEGQALTHLQHCAEGANHDAK